MTPVQNDLLADAAPRTEQIATGHIERLRWQVPNELKSLTVFPETARQAPQEILLTRPLPMNLAQQRAALEVCKCRAPNTQIVEPSNKVLTVFPVAVVCRKHQRSRVAAISDGHGQTVSCLEGRRSDDQLGQGLGAFIRYRHLLKEACKNVTALREPFGVFPPSVQSRLVAYDLLHLLEDPGLHAAMLPLDNSQSEPEQRAVVPVVKQRPEFAPSCRRRFGHAGALLEPIRYLTDHIGHGVVSGNGCAPASHGARTAPARERPAGRA